MFAIITNRAGNQEFFGNLLGRVEFASEAEANHMAIVLRATGAYAAVAVVSLS